MKDYVDFLTVTLTISCVFALGWVTGNQQAKRSIYKEFTFDPSPISECSVSPPCPQKRVVSIEDGVTNTIYKGSGTEYFNDNDIEVVECYGSPSHTRNKKMSRSEYDYYFRWLGDAGWEEYTNSFSGLGYRSDDTTITLRPAFDLEITNSVINGSHGVEDAQ